jgi:hypothetical protein
MAADIDNELIKAWESLKKKKGSGSADAQAQRAHDQHAQVKRSVGSEAEEKSEEKELEEAVEPEEKKFFSAPVLPERSSSLEFRERNLEEAVGGMTPKKEKEEEKKEESPYVTSPAYITKEEKEERKYEKPRIALIERSHHPVFERPDDIMSFGKRRVDMPMFREERERSLGYSASKTLAEEKIEFEKKEKIKYKPIH